MVTCASASLGIEHRVVSWLYPWRENYHLMGAYTLRYNGKAPGSYFAEYKDIIIASVAL